MNKKFILCIFLVLFTLDAYCGVLDWWHYRSGGLVEFNNDIANHPEPYESDGKIKYIRGYNVHVFPNISVSTGIQAISYDLGSKDLSTGLEVLPSITPIQINFVLMQYVMIEWIKDINTGDFTRKISPQQTWTASFGLVVADDENASFPIGFSLIPYQFVREEFSIGIGFQWLNRESTFMDANNFSIVLPFSYNLSL